MTTHQSARFILVPGFWLGGWAWDRVAAPLRAAGHVVAALTLPGLENVDTRRDGITLDDHIVTVVDALSQEPDRPAVLVAHSGAGAVIYGATDRVPHLVRRAVYVDSGPLPDGGATRPDLDPTLSELPLPSWEEFERSGTSLAGLASTDLDHFRSRAVPHPAGPAREPLRLKDPARLAVPVTLVASSFRPDDIRHLAAAGHPFFAELPHVSYTIIDLPTGHWPMWSRADDLAHALIDASAE